MRKQAPVEMPKNLGSPGKVQPGATYVPGHHVQRESSGLLLTVPQTHVHVCVAKEPAYIHVY